MKSEHVKYKAGSTECHGYVAYNPSISTPKPGVIIAHAWKGQDAFARGKAEALAELGYVGFAADVYGEGKNAKDNDEAIALMSPLFLDRALLRERITAAYETLKNHPEVDAHHIGGIGFCFGGITIIELLRGGADVRGVVSFHGTLAQALGEQKAQQTPMASGIKGSVLAIHGHDDPLVSAEDVAVFAREFTEAGVDWQLHVYGHTSHAFTNPEANEPDFGLIYNPKANKRSWVAMQNFFEEVFV